MKKTLLTTLLCSLMMTACSSGGSDNGQSNNIQNSEQSVKEKANGKANELKDKVKAQADKAEEKAKDIQSDTKDKADEVKEKAKSESDKAEEKAKDIQSDTKDKTDEVKEKAKSESDKAEEKAKDIQSDTKDKTDEVKEKAKSESDKAEEKAKDIQSDTKDKTDEAKEKVKSESDKAEEKAKDAKADEKLDDRNDPPAYMAVDVNGTQMDLTLGENADVPGYNDLRYDENIDSRYSTNYQHSVFGYVIDRKAKTSNFFAQGESTLEAKMPSEGKISYHGDTLYFAGGDLQEGSANMSANFGKKTVEGAIIHRDGHELANFRGQIHGNRFTAHEGLNVDGGFYGDSAQEAAGQFEGRVNDKEITGAFAVKQQ
ncbi:hypothetical protein HPC38_08500 [Pasteurellaceae bacterium HPA106]|uniref:transferrin-binding protein-like solute binding protein n=1 Tax=Spirabiliibacterium pneumoniae TaxID=221400 RepID=UPI001AACC7B3|nr:transferrin-binding protein-like solute binding protein [Spirabiliibacterium pneumoniae]MBE2896911.1 hypothetical protein [Spirabiliibacterium pneumoniae]